MYDLVLFENEVLGEQYNAHINSFLLITVYNFDCFERLRRNVYGQIFFDHVIHIKLDESKFSE